jgi:hypothetical protein
MDRQFFAKHNDAPGAYAAKKVRAHGGSAVMEQAGRQSLHWRQDRTQEGAAVTARETVHQLLDDLPDDILPEVARYLGALRDDPLARLLLTAPIDDEPETEEERAAVQEAREAAARGEVYTLDEVKRDLGL